MNAVEFFSKKWPKKECVDDSALSEWVKVIRHLVKRRVYFLLNSMSTRSKSVSYKEIRLRQNWLIYMINMLLFLLTKHLTTWYGV